MDILGRTSFEDGCSSRASEQSQEGTRNQLGNAFGGAKRHNQGTQPQQDRMGIGSRQRRWKLLKGGLHAQNTLQRATENMILNHKF